MWIRAFILIHTKIWKWPCLWPILHHLSELHWNPSNSFCIILLNNKQINSSTFNQSHKLYGRKTGTLCKISNPTECNNLQTPWKLNVNEYIAKTRFLTFDLVNTSVFYKCALILNLIAATCGKRTARGPCLPSCWTSFSFSNNTLSQHSVSVCRTLIVAVLNVEFCPILAWWIQLLSSPTSPLSNLHFIMCLIFSTGVLLEQIWTPGRPVYYVLSVSGRIGVISEDNSCGWQHVFSNVMCKLSTKCHLLHLEIHLNHSWNYLRQPFFFQLLTIVI